MRGLDANGGPEEHGSVMSGARRARRSHSSIALTVDPPPPTHRQVVKKPRALPAVGDRERLVLTALQDRPGAHVLDLALATGLTAGQVRYSLGILRQHRLADSARVDQRTAWTATSPPPAPMVPRA